MRRSMPARTAAGQPGAAASPDLAAGTGPRRAGDLATATGLSGPALSRHLRVLRASGVVQTEVASHDARLRIYSLRHEPFRNLQRWLDQVEMFWTHQLGAFKWKAMGLPYPLESTPAASPDLVKRVLDQFRAAGCNAR